MLAAVTGWGQHSDRQGSRDAGFDYHLVKPLDFSELVAVLAELSRARRPAGANA